MNTTRDPLNVNAFQPSRFRPTASARASFIADPESRADGISRVFERDIKRFARSFCSCNEQRFDGGGDSFFFFFSFERVKERREARVRRVGGGHFRALG